MARYSPKAFPTIQPWQGFHLKHPQRSLGQKKRPFMATYRHYVSKIRWFWQDSRAVYPKSPANRCLGIHCVKFLPGRAANPVRGPQIIHSAHILPSRLVELRKSPTPDRPPLAPITIRDEMPMNFSGEHSAQRLRYEQAPKGRRSGASGWASDPADKEPLGWASAPPIGRFWMAVCPADRAPPDGRLPPIGRLRMLREVPQDADGALAPPDQTISTPTPCPCKRKKATP